MLVLCGFLGAYFFNDDHLDYKQSILASTDVISHRGPDYTGHYSTDKFCAIHHRLSIIDLDDRSNQPFHSDEGRYTLVFNGEIYNYEELKSQLASSGIPFKTNGDTEVLLQLLKLKGKKALTELNGCFAFAFYDNAEHTALIARDAMGIKPMWIHQDSNALTFASELKALLRINNSKDLDYNVLSSYLLNTYTSGPCSIVKDVIKLAPGHICEISMSGVKINNWTKELQIDKLDIESALQKAVKSRLVADVPVGTFLSGGLDSSIITLLASKEHRSINSFSVSFPDFPTFDESIYAQKCAEHFKTSHHDVRMSLSDMESELEHFINALDEPFADSSSLAMSFVSKHAREHVKVVLSGDGADELFGGYNKHTAIFKANSFGPLSSSLVNLAGGALKPILSGSFGVKIEKLRRGLNLSSKERYMFWARWNDVTDVQELLGDRFGVSEVSYLNDLNFDNFKDNLIADQRMVLPNDMLHKVDLMSMSHGLEVRTPFLDWSVVSLARKLQIDQIHNGKVGKLILRNKFQKDLPKEILTRKKQGFEIPIASLLRADSKRVKESLFSLPHLFSEKMVSKLSASFFDSKNDQNARLLWTMYIFTRWHHKNLIG